MKVDFLSAFGNLETAAPIELGTSQMAGFQTTVLNVDKFSAASGVHYQRSVCE